MRMAAPARCSRFRLIGFKKVMRPLSREKEFRSRRSGVSYALELTEPSRSDLRHLEFWLQEETLDEIELLAAHPPAKSRRTGDWVRDFVRRRGGKTFYVFITSWPDHNAQVVRIKRIGLYVRPDESPD
jgi:hypothetical protein